MAPKWVRCAREGCNRQFRESKHGKVFCGKKCRNRVMSQRFRERYQKALEVANGLGPRKMKEMRIP